MVGPEARTVENWCFRLTARTLTDKSIDYELLTAAITNSTASTASAVQLREKYKPSHALSNILQMSWESQTVHITKHIQGLLSGLLAGVMAFKHSL